MKKSFLTVIRVPASVGAFAQALGLRILAAVVVVGFSASAFGQTSRTWTGAGADANWTTPANWGGTAPAEGDKLVFPASATAYPATNDFTAGTRFDSIQIDSSSYTFGGNAIQLDNGITDTAAATVTLPLGITLTTLSPAQTFSIVSGVLALTGKVTGAGGITVSGSGVLALSNTTSDYSGGTTVNAGGTLTAQSANCLGTGTITILSGGELDFETSGATFANAISVAGAGANGAITCTSGSNTLSGAVTLTGNAQFFVNPSQALTFSGAIGDGGGGYGITIVGSGITTFSGATDNTYTGLTTVSGTSAELDLYKTGKIAIPGDLTINKTVKSRGSNQIADSSIVTVNGGGTLSLNGYNDTIGGLVLNGVGSAPTVSTGIGVLTLASGGGLTTSGTVSANFGPYLAVAAGPHTFNIGKSLSLSFNSGLTGAGDVVKTGSGALTLGGDNASYTRKFTGSITIDAGIIIISNDKALGTTAGSVTVNDGASLGISGGSLSIPNRITLAGQGAPGPGGALVNITLNSLPSTLSGAITLAADATIATASGSALNFTGEIGEIGGSHGVTLAGRGSVFYTSATGNTYTGPTVVSGGSNLWLNGGRATVLGSLTVGDGINASVLQDQASGSLSSSSAATVAAGSTLRLLGTSETIASLSLQSTANTSATLATGSGTLTLAAGGDLTTDSSKASAFTGKLALAAGSHNINLGSDLSLSTLSGSGDFTKLGVAFLKLNSANDSYSGNVTISAGRVDLVNGGALGSGSVTVNDSASLTVADGITVTNPISLSGYGVSGAGAIQSFGGINGYAGPITLLADAGIGVWADSLTISQIANSVFTLRKSGTSSLIVTGTPAFADSFAVFAGTLQVDGTLAATGSATVSSGATLDGTGTAGQVTVLSGGHFAPGQSPGTITATSLTLNSGALFDEEINGTTAGTLYDVTQVSGSPGTVALGNATLNLTLGYTPAVGDTYAIINATGGVSGTFKDSLGNTLTNGATLTVASQLFRINYTSTTVTLTAVLPTTTVLVSSLNPSTSGSNVTFTSTVSPSAASGTVTFKDGTTTLGTGTLSGGVGVATFTTNGLSGGRRSITAAYGGDGNYNGSVSSPLTQIVAWVPVQSGFWDDTATWGGTLPDAGDDVVIPPGITVTVRVDPLVVRNLTVIGALTVNGAPTIQISGNFTNNGAFTPGTGTVTLTNGADQTLVATAPGALNFYKLTENKSATNNTVTCASHLTVSKKLTLTKGKLISASDYGDCLLYTSDAADE